MMIAVGCRVFYTALLVGLREEPTYCATLLLGVALLEWAWLALQLHSPSPASPSPPVSPAPVARPVPSGPPPGAAYPTTPMGSSEDDVDDPVDYSRFSRVFSLHLHPSERMAYPVPASPLRPPRRSARRSAPAPASSSPAKGASSQASTDSSPARPKRAPAREKAGEASHSPAKRLPARTLDGDRAHHLAKQQTLSGTQENAAPPAHTSPMVVPLYRASKLALPRAPEPHSPPCAGEYEVVPQKALSLYADYQESAHRQQLAAQKEKERADAEARAEAQRQAEAEAQRQAAEREKEKEAQRQAEAKKEQEAQQRAQQEAEAQQAQAQQEKEAQQAQQDKEAQESASEGPLPSTYYEENILALVSSHPMPPDLSLPKPIVYARVTFTDESIDLAVQEITTPWKNYPHPTPVAAAHYWDSVSKRLLERKKVEGQLNLILPVTEVMMDVAQAYPEFARCLEGKLGHAYPNTEGRFDAKITQRFPSNAKFTVYIKDTCAVMGMYALLLIRRPHANPWGGLEKAWQWLSRVGNTTPTEETPWVLQKFLLVTAHPLLQRYPTQFPKLIRYFAEVYCPLFQSLNQKYINAPTTQLLKFFEDYATNKSFTPYDQINVT